MTDTDDWLAELKKLRDEVRLHLHLGARDAEDELDQLMKEWYRFASRAQFDKSADEVGDAAKELGLKMKAAYDRLNKA